MHAAGITDRGDAATEPEFADATVIAAPHVGWSIGLLLALNGCRTTLQLPDPESRVAAEAALDHWQQRSEAAATLSDLDRARLGSLRANIVLSPAGHAPPAPDLVVVELRDTDGVDGIVQMEHRCLPDTVLGVATLLLPLGPITDQFRRPERVIGMHFMHPAHARKAIEVIPTAATSDEVLSRVVSFCERDLDLNTVVCSDRTGFVVNRVHLAYLAAAATVAADYPEGVEQLDELIREALGLRMGPFRLMDELGIANVARSLEIMSARYGPTYATTGLLAQLVEQGRLGRRSGRGFLSYEVKV